MSNSRLKCCVITPERTVLDAEAEFVVLPAHDGEIGVLRDRAPLLCRLGVGLLRVDTPQGSKRLFVDAGFAEVLNNRVSVLTEQALAADQIEIAKEQVAADAARQRHAVTADEQAARQRNLARAAAKIKLASKD